MIADFFILDGVLLYVITLCNIYNVLYCYFTTFRQFDKFIIKWECEVDYLAYLAYLINTITFNGICTRKHIHIILFTAT